MRFDGLMLIMVARGEANVTLNTNTYTMKEGSITVMGPNDVIVSSLHTGAPVEVYTLFMSHDFIGGINFDVNIINTKHIIDRSPIIDLSTRERSLVRRYLELLHQCALDNTSSPDQLNMISRSIGRNIVVALLYQLTFINERRQLMTAPDPAVQMTRPRSRKATYIKDFLALLQTHYRRERTVAFYASQLCISPKYLSLIVRDVTGHTAAEIIDQYVINEAKNMLRFSGYTIQQVAYKLNFANQSAFGKYFKHITGHSPSAFRSH